MTKTYKVSGMTCGNCKRHVEEALVGLDGIKSATVNLEKQQVTLETDKVFTTEALQTSLPSKYTISSPITEGDSKKDDEFVDNFKGEQSKIQQLRPLILILFYILVASVLLNSPEWNTRAFMLDFMGLFLIVFSFFKMLDLKGFPESFRMYDPLAKRLPIYARLYPFIETALGLMFLLRFEVTIAIIISLVLLSITTIGVTKSLMDKKSIRCACLGTALKLPMTEATFIENAIMIAMGVFMLM